MWLSRWLRVWSLSRGVRFHRTLRLLHFHTWPQVCTQTTICRASRTRMVWDAEGQEVGESLFTSKIFVFSTTSFKMFRVSVQTLSHMITNSQNTICFVVRNFKKKYYAVTFDKLKNEQSARRPRWWILFGRLKNIWSSQSLTQNLISLPMTRKWQKRLGATVSFWMDVSTATNSFTCRTIRDNFVHSYVKSALCVGRVVIFLTVNQKRSFVLEYPPDVY